MSDTFLDKVYDVEGGDATRDLYDQWSASYEAEVAANGYVTPGRCAEALAAALRDTSRSILDFGCGTGLSGLALRNQGFEVIDGVDLSAEMLEQARDKGLYRTLSQIEADGPLPNVPEGYTAITAIGVIGAGAAPLAVLDRLIDHLDRNGFLCFSFNDHTLEDPAYEARVSEYCDTGAVRLVSREYGPHLRGLDMNSTVYVIQKN